MLQKKKKKKKKKMRGKEGPNKRTDIRTDRAQKGSNSRNFAAF
jgi:hypothetical protein